MREDILGRLQHLRRLSNTTARGGHNQTETRPDFFTGGPRAPDDFMNERDQLAFEERELL
jgi:hypothetical protein